MLRTFVYTIIFPKGDKKSFYIKEHSWQQALNTARDAIDLGTVDGKLLSLTEIFP